MTDLGKILWGAAATVVAGTVVFVTGQAILYFLTRSAVLAGIREEAVTSKNAIATLRAHASKALPKADALVDAVRQKKLTFDELNSVPSGFILYVPTYSVIDVVSKLRHWSPLRTEKVIQAVIRYLDRWGTVSLVEKSYSASHAKLVELSPKIAEDSERARLLETADQVSCCLKELVVRFDKLNDAAREIELLVPVKSPKTKK